MKNDGLFAYHLQRPNWIIEEAAVECPWRLAFVFAVPLLLHFLFLSFAQTHKRPAGTLVESHKERTAPERLDEG